ncbi:MAG: hypothetical protein HC807_00520 [Gammaproteobacteria bacterium]|nr:hypothetical protein [Gammaproteobacteria bacterium]
MDYFQGVVTEYLRANRSVFVNTECLIQLDEGDKQIKGRHWFCDAMAVSFKESTVFLCEITYSSTMQSLISRLQAWRKNWHELNTAVLRDSGAPNDWKVQPWIFIPQKHHAAFLKKFEHAQPDELLKLSMPSLRITYLETVLPWEYKSTWDRKIDSISGAA